MKKKRIISIMLAVVMLLFGSTQYLTELYAAEGTASEREDTDQNEYSVTIESGKKFHFGDMVDWLIDGVWRCASEFDTTYLSDHPEVITVDESGNASTKETGDAIVTVSYRELSAVYRITVVEKGSLTAGNEELVAKWAAAGRKLARKIPSKLSVENGYSLIKAARVYLQSFEGADNAGTGYDMEDIHALIYGWRDFDCTELVVPEALYFNRAKNMMQRYVAKYHPMYQKKYWMNKQTKYEMSANTNKITLKFKKKITDQALLALYFEEALYPLNSDDSWPWIIVDIKKGLLESYVYLEDTKEKTGMAAIAVFKKGSRTVTITQRAKTKMVNGKRKYIKKKKLNLKKGTIYKMYNGNLFFDAYTEIAV